MKKVISSIIVFFASFLVYHAGFGCNIFPTDEATNVLQAPNWYPIVGIFFAASITALFNKRKDVVSHFKRAAKLRGNENDPLGERFHRTDDKLRRYYPKAVELFRKYGFCTASLLQLNLDVSWDNGKTLMKWMEQNGIMSEAPNPDAVKIMDPFIAVDMMDGHDFEYWCADLLQRNGFTNVEVTPGSGDQGVDIIATKDGIRYAIQCKRYSSDLGNTPVQEVSAGKALYHCQVGAVMTNQRFTAGAKELAEATGTLLWDRDKLSEMLKVKS